MVHERKLPVVSTHVPARGGHVFNEHFYRFRALFQHTCPREAGTWRSLGQSSGF